MIEATNTQSSIATRGEPHGGASLKGAVKKFIPRRLLRWLTNNRAVVWMRATAKGWALRKRSHDEVYGADYFKMVDETTGKSAKIMARSLVDQLRPWTAVDLGCGTGNLMAELNALGVATRGVEYAEAALAYCRERGLHVEKADFTADGAFDSTVGEFDLAISTEVVIQLAPDVARNYIEYLCRHSDTVLFSSPPCARDRLPKSPQTSEYWIGVFEENGFELDRELSRDLQKRWQEEGTAPWFHRDPMIFRRSA